MKRLVLGPVQFAAERAFIPIIEEVAETGDAAGVFFARLLSLVILESEGVWVYPFYGSLSLTELLSAVPELEHVMMETRKTL
jgi:hypothetical protein